MNLEEMTEAYDFTGQAIVITGGGGVLAREIVRALLGCNASVAVIARDPAKAERAIGEIDQTKGRLTIVRGDVLDRERLQVAGQEILQDFGKIDALINAAGGNNPHATTSDTLSFFDLPEEAMRSVFDLNLVGTILPSQVFGKVMAGSGSGVILNISSMTAFRPLTRVMAYSAVKAAIDNFTAWLAVHLAQECGPALRVNAVAPGFFLTEQNRFLLTEKKTGELTERGRKIIDHTPMERFGEPAELLGAVLWLLSPLSSFVTGIVLPVDGGFGAYSGV
jgi:NAD(P)-dependent dehydrogenase (short-subunit alcohol dehydrogenase family)